MPLVETLAGSLGIGKAASTAGGGTALSGTAATIMLPLRTRQFQLTPRNFSTAVVVEWTKVPWLTVLKTTDLLAAIANTTDYSSAAQDNDTNTDVVLSSLDTIANLDALYVGSPVPFLGAVIDVDAVNSNASVLTVKYMKSDGTWADITATDGTASGGASMAQDGNVTWTQPTDWIARELYSFESGVDPRFGWWVRRPQFWTRWQFSAALDASTTLNSLVALPVAAYEEIPTGFQWVEACEPVGPGGRIAGIRALTDAGTANLIVNVNAGSRGYFA